MRDFLIVLSGANREVLKDVPAERTKFVGIGGAVLTTSVLATISMWFALSSALGVSAAAAVPMALLWGLAILGLDRWLVTSIPAEGRRRVRLALPRIAMALLLGFVISTPLVLQIFRAEIDTQITVIQQRETDAFLRNLKTGDGGQDVEYWRAEVAKHQRTITSNGDEPTDPAKDEKVVSLTGQRNEAQKTADKHYKEWQCQLYGGSGCTVEGAGPLADASERAYRKAAGLVTSLDQQIENRKKELTATDRKSKATRLQEAQEALPKAKEQLDTALSRQNALQQRFDAETGTSGGILLRLQALNEITGGDMTLAVTRILLFLLFLLFECLPVLVKLMQSPGNYDKLLEIESRNQLRKARLLRQGAGPGGPDRPREEPRARRPRRDDDFSVHSVWRRDQPQDPVDDVLKTRSAPPPEQPQPPRPPAEEEQRPWSEPEERIPSPTSLDHLVLKEMEDLRFGRKSGAPAEGADLDLFGDEKF
ncbi:DUF4407 domain-containing protein [Actinocorallia libanotica]|uniref:DUF4407 domain-containing protein n=1 Tax=Actinocorallia libanotica TaxID=46162 RepID=A0ABN1QU98_9ACTN